MTRRRPRPAERSPTSTEPASATPARTRSHRCSPFLRAVGRDLRDLLLLPALPALLPGPAPAEHASAPPSATSAVSQYTDVLGGKEFRDGLLHLGPLRAAHRARSASCSACCWPWRPTGASGASRSSRRSSPARSPSSVAVASVVFFVLINPQVGYFRDVGFISLTDPDTALRGVALSSVWQNLGPHLHHRAGRAAGGARGDLRGGHPRRLRPVPPVLPGHPAADLADMMFLVVVLVCSPSRPSPRSTSSPAAVRPGSTETLVWKIFNSQQPLDQGIGAVMAIGLFGDHPRRDRPAVPDPQPAGALWELTSTTPTWKKAALVRAC